MPKIVEIPGEGNVEFPDEMTDEQIGTVIRQRKPSQDQSKPRSMSERLFGTAPATTSWGNIPRAAVDVLEGVGAGLLSSARGIQRWSYLPASFMPGMPKEIPKPLAIPEEWGQAPPTMAGTIGKAAEQVGEAFIPFSKVGKVAQAFDVAATAPRAAKVLALGKRAALEGATTGAVTAAQSGSPKEGLEAGALGAGVSAAASAVPMMFGSQLNTVLQKAVDWAEAHGIPTSFGQRRGSRQLQRVEQGLENLPGSAGRTQEFFKGQEEALARTGGQLAQQVMPGPATSGLEAGQGVGSKIRSTIADEKAKADAAYDEARNIYAQNVQQRQIGRGQWQNFETPVDLKDAKRWLAPIYDELSQTMPVARQQASPGYRALGELLNGPDVVDAVVADRNLGALKAVARSGANPYLNSRSQGLAKQAIEALETDFQKAIGPEAQAKLTQGRAAVFKQHRLAELLADLPDEAAPLYQRLVTAGDKSYGLLQELNKVAPDEMRQVGRTFMDGLLQKATTEGGFNRAPGIFADWQRLGPNTKKLLFGSQQTIDDLDNFFQAAKYLRTNMNPSGTGPFLAALGPIGIGLDLVFGPGSYEDKVKRGGGAVIGMNALSRALLTPGGPKALTPLLQVLVSQGVQFANPPERVPSFAKGGIVTSGPPRPHAGKEDIVDATTETRLDAAGKAETRQIAAAIARKGGVLRILSSPWDRAEETAKIIATKLGVKVEDAGRPAGPWALGALEGQKSDHVKRQIARYILQEPDMPPPGPSKYSNTPPESFNRFRKRTLAFFRDWLAKATDDKELLVTHSRDIKLLEAWLRKGAPEDLSIDAKFMAGDDDLEQELHWLHKIGGRWRLDMVDLESPSVLQSGRYILRHGLTPWSEQKRVLATAQKQLPEGPKSRTMEIPRRRIPPPVMLGLRI